MSTREKNHKSGEIKKTVDLIYKSFPDLGTKVIDRFSMGLMSHRLAGTIHGTYVELHAHPQQLLFH